MSDEQSAWLDCRPYRRMADRVMEACIESTTYDELYARCMDAMEEAEAGAKEVVEQAHIERMRRIVRGDK